MRGPLTLLLLSLLCTCGLAQTEPITGAKAPQSTVGIQDAQTLDAMLYYVPGLSSPGRTELLKQDIKSFMMPVREASSPGLEWAYALTAALEFYHNLNTNYKDNLSPDYLHLTLANQGTRPTLEDGLRMVTEQGTVSASIVPFGATTIPYSVYSVPKIQVANFGYLFRSTTRARNRLFELKKALTRGNPVLVELRTGADFAGLSTSTYEFPEVATEQHFLTVTGFDASTEMIELRGSFGRLWAQGGYCTMSFDDFVEYSVNAYVLFPIL